MDTIEQGQEILDFEMEEIARAGYGLDSIIYITKDGNPVSVPKMDCQITKEIIIYP
ncbi:MAG: hypothetical protein PHE02_12945 [Lachnospiraceae bacterium]|nr:hypothetical protein [Lachnospiraceae bacterium]